MEQFRKFDMLKMSTLWVKRHGWFKPSYELTDNQFTYGTLRYEGIWRPKTIIETVDTIWQIKKSAWGNMEISTADGILIGNTSQKAFSRRINFAAGDGFIATFYNPSIWKGTCIWEDDKGQEILRIERPAFKPAYIVFNELVPQNKYTLLLAFMALEIHLSRQRHAAIAAST